MYGQIIPPNEIPVYKEKKKWPWIVGSIAAGLVLCCGGVSVLALTTSSGQKGLSDSSGSKRINSSTNPDVKYYTPTPKDFKATVKVTKKQCFGSAGCNVTFRLDQVRYTGQAMDKSKKYEVVYEVTGLDDPYTNSFTLRGDGQFEVDQEESGSTPNTNSQLKVTITSVDQM